ncbi:putative component of type VI protein secretion system [Kineosphaera limosa]|uniref:Bacterial proteasome activator n=1 Tax=Kineosphaera limosa NBRC 100340 TaxID=1184609 RepID=K6WG69_9MICO|nr:bacterial proteasome activator family protein [Kineosphaera limosa]NYE01594.1 putative component of type VI protein secretion system [Kineosphaera limosa]GAB98270.1 hypothetical protein KILIM_120_00050 [Kineosphaera limosa NBRC 100340]
MSEQTQGPDPHDTRPDPQTDEHPTAAASNGAPSNGAPSNGAASNGAPSNDAAKHPEGERIVVLTDRGMGVHDPGETGDTPTDLIEQPAKVMRIGAMVKQLLEEVRSAPLDEKGRARLAEVHRRSIRELEDGLAPELVDELERITLPFTDDAPSDAELRIAQAQLVGWLEGLFHGIQAALFAQQMAAQQQLQQMRRALPGQVLPPGTGAAGQGGPGPFGQLGQKGDSGPTGQYL